jgi:soluble lytic murein transglycosylase-like protein
MDPEDSIELGATYVRFPLFDSWMKEVAKVNSRIYCFTAGYNSSPGSVARALTGSTRNLAEASKSSLLWPRVPPWAQ